MVDFFHSPFFKLSHKKVLFSATGHGRVDGGTIVKPQYKLSCFCLFYSHSHLFYAFLLFLGAEESIGYEDNPLLKGRVNGEKPPYHHFEIRLMGLSGDQDNICLKNVPLEA